MQVECAVHGDAGQQRAGGSNRRLHDEIEQQALLQISMIDDQILCGLRGVCQRQQRGEQALVGLDVLFLNIGCKFTTYECVVEARPDLGATVVSHCVTSAGLEYRISFSCGMWSSYLPCRKGKVEGEKGSKVRLVFYFNKFFEYRQGG